MAIDYRSRAILLIGGEERYAYFIDAGAGWQGGFLVFTKAGKGKRRHGQHVERRDLAEKLVRDFMEQETDAPKRTSAGNRVILDKSQYAIPDEDKGLIIWQSASRVALTPYATYRLFLLLSEIYKEADTDALYEAYLEHASSPGASEY